MGYTKLAPYDIYQMNEKTAEHHVLSSISDDNRRHQTRRIQYPTEQDTVVIVSPNTGLEQQPTGTPSNVVYGEPVGALDDFRSSDLYIALLVAVIIFVVGGIVMLGGALSKK